MSPAAAPFRPARIPHRLRSPRRSFLGRASYPRMAVPSPSSAKCIRGPSKPTIEEILPPGRRRNSSEGSSPLSPSPRKPFPPDGWREQHGLFQGPPPSHPGPGRPPSPVCATGKFRGGPLPIDSAPSIRFPQKLFPGPPPLSPPTNNRGMASGGGGARRGPRVPLVFGSSPFPDT